MPGDAVSERAGKGPEQGLEAGWELFQHDADVGVRGWGPTAAEAFAQAALALTAVITEPERVRPREAVPVRAQSPELELLLVDYLNALIYEMATRHLLFARHRVRILPEPTAPEEAPAEGYRLEGEAEGEPVDRERHRPAVEPKGATYTELAVRREASGRWVAQCVVDV